MSLGKPVGFAWTVTVLGRGSASVERTVRRAVIVQTSPGERASAAMVKLALTVLGRGSGSPAMTVRVALMVQVSPGERIPSALLLVMKELEPLRRFPRRLSLTEPLTRLGESAEPLFVIVKV